MTSPSAGCKVRGEMARKEAEERREGGRESGKEGGREGGRVGGRDLHFLVIQQHSIDLAYGHVCRLLRLKVHEPIALGGAILVHHNLQQPVRDISKQPPPPPPPPPSLSLLTLQDRMLPKALKVS